MMYLRGVTGKLVKNSDLSYKKSVDVEFAVVDKILQALETELIHIGPS